MRAERPLVRISAGWVVFGGLVLLAAVPVYVFVEPPLRALVVRLAAALVLGPVLLELRRLLAERLANLGASKLDEAGRRQWPEADIPLRFQDLMLDVRATLRSRRHFEKVFWPRLTGLTARPLVRPPVRPGRGPSLASLREVIADIEKQS